MTHLQQIAVLANIREALGGKRFDISGIAHACQVLGRPIYTGDVDWTLLRALHCKEASLFDDAARRELLEVCGRVLGVEEAELTELTNLRLEA